MKTDLSSYDNSWYHPGGNRVKRFIWYYVNCTIFNTGLFPVNFLKVLLLRVFGANIGSDVTIKPCVNIKYPWLLEIGDHVWVGEGVWIDNLTKISIRNHCCLSQGVMLLTGNHDYTKPTFDLVVKGIDLDEGVWIGAQSIVCPGVRCKTHAVLAVGSVASTDLEAFAIYRGNPAVKVKDRSIDS